MKLIDNIKSKCIDMKVFQSKSLDVNNITIGDPSLKYKLSKQIGVGSFSIVYYATDNQMNEFAVKQIPLSKFAKMKLNILTRELNISLQMNHHNIVKAHEIFKTDINWYIVSEYCNFGTLADLKANLDEVSNIDKEKLCKYYLKQLMKALEYLNKNNIVHRDLKPKNILLTKDRKNNNAVTVKLADFGLARYFDVKPGVMSGNEFMTSTYCGTPLYMAPEILIDSKCNLKADLWSFGVIMYELLYGYAPYDYPKTIPDLQELIKSKSIEFKKIYSKECIDLLQKLLQVDPKARIEWSDFFDHKWFKSKEQQPEIRTDDVFKFDEDIELEDEIQKNMTSDYFNNDVDSNLSNSSDDFVIITDSIKLEEICNVPVRRETYTGSVIKILSDSISYIWGQAKSY